MSLRSNAAALRRCAKDGIKARWTHIAKSWRLMAERSIAARTGGERSGWAAVEPAPIKPMGYQQSFYTLS